MELADEITIPAPRAKVYDALNDVEILKACIPGCEELDKESDTELVAKVTLKVGPVKARFSGRVTLDRSRAPDSFSLAGEGDGGIENGLVDGIIDGRRVGTGERQYEKEVERQRHHGLQKLVGRRGQHIWTRRNVGEKEEAKVDGKRTQSDRPWRRSGRHHRHRRRA